jgi:hypothetical protein
MEQQLVRLTRAEQTELKRLGCFPGQPDGKWGADTKRSIAAFNAHSASLKLDESSPSEEHIKQLTALDRAVCAVQAEAPEKRSPSPVAASASARRSAGAGTRSGGAVREGRSPSPSLGGSIGVGGF